MPKIRPYERSDIDSVRTICIKTTDMRIRTEVQRQSLLNTYCNYYAECEPQNCFVAADDNDNAIGYIFCAEDYARYEKKFSEKYIPIIKKISKLKAMVARSTMLINRKYAGYFPAHMHIDILPEYQRMGLGTQLVDTLVEHLKEKNVRGLMLVVSAKNTTGMNFYAKYGFRKIGSISGAVAMGLELM
ncbi:MAG TPA: GNAT family N-acetyltransferase [Clostridia bacterium]|nr:GNAT family N-acetyltransferase [Clostridia bacterium]